MPPGVEHQIERARKITRFQILRKLRVTQQVKDVLPVIMSTDGVRKLAEEYAEKILAKKPDCVMCQGEFCLSWHVIARLKEAGVRVAAACSERIVEEVYGENGTEKRSVFRFVQFREY